MSTGWRKSSPCPVCGGYAAYKKEKRCRGYARNKGDGVYCENKNPRRDPIFPLGFALWFWRKDEYES
jgi:hypothetical protein